MKIMDGIPRMMTLVILSVFLLPMSPCSAGSNVHVGQQVPSGQRVSLDQIDHSTWDRLLRQYVDEDGNVAYAQWKRSSQDRQALESYLNSISAADPNAQASRAAKLAFWINAYNALTVHGILREYPTSSIRNHTAKLFGYNIWDDLLLKVGSKDYSLNQMEHEVLRKMGEPRIHFAIVCASRSCPRLLNEAYTADQLEEQLVTNTRHFFATSGNFQYDAARRQFRLSSIIKWFGEDFGDNQAAQLRTIAPYLPSREASQAATANSVSVSYLDYDWGLNDQSPALANREK